MTWLDTAFFFVLGWVLYSYLLRDLISARFLQGEAQHSY